MQLIFLICEICLRLCVCVCSAWDGCYLIGSIVYSFAPTLGSMFEFASLSVCMHLV